MTTVAPLRNAISIIAAALAAAGSALAPADAQSFSADYSVSILGIPIARSSFTTFIEGDRFRIEGSLSSAGVARLFDDTEGTTSVSGRLDGGAVEPEAYVVEYTSGDKRQKTAISFSGGDVTHTENVPPLKQRKNWVPVGEGDLKAVADPLSATLVPAASIDEVCGRTLRIYDGEMRADLELSPSASGPIWPQHEGEAVTCRVRFVPVSGYREGRDAIDFLKNKAKILIAFAPLGATGVYAPVQASVGTEIGTLRIEAQSLETE